MQKSYSLLLNDFNLMNKLDARMWMCAFGGKTSVYACISKCEDSRPFPQNGFVLF